MISLSVFVMQAGIGPCCRCRCAAAAAGHRQRHGAPCAPHSFLVGAGNVVSCATPGPACLPAPSRETQAALMGGLCGGLTAHFALWLAGCFGLAAYGYAQVSVRRLVDHRGACRFVVDPRSQCGVCWGQSHMLGVGMVRRGHCCRFAPLYDHVAASREQRQAGHIRSDGGGRARRRDSPLAARCATFGSCV